MSALGEFEQLVLFAVLRLDEDASGVAIHDEILARTGRDVSPGAIYTTLGRLEERGLVRSVVVAAATSRVGRPRKHYELRPAGAKALREAYDTIQALAVGLLPKLSELAKGR
jgi:DNA-binding PadR family transcriptional regulator